MKALMFGWEFPPHILGGLRNGQFRFDTRHGNAARYGYYFLYTEALGR